MKFGRLFASFDGTAPVGNEILTEHDECSRRNSAREGLGDRHLADIRLDRAIERQVFRECVDEHQCVVDVRANDRFLSSRLGKPQPPLGDVIPTRGTTRTMIRLGIRPLRNSS